MASRMRKGTFAEEEAEEDPFIYGDEEESDSDDGDVVDRHDRRYFKKIEKRSLRTNKTKAELFDDLEPFGAGSSSSSSEEERKPPQPVKEVIQLEEDSEDKPEDASEGRKVIDLDESSSEEESKTAIKNEVVDLEAEEAESEEEEEEEGEELSGDEEEEAEDEEEEESMEEEEESAVETEEDSDTVVAEEKPKRKRLRRMIVDEEEEEEEEKKGEPSPVPPEHPSKPAEAAARVPEPIIVDDEPVLKDAGALNIEPRKVRTRLPFSSHTMKFVRRFCLPKGWKVALISPSGRRGRCFSPRSIFF